MLLPLLPLLPLQGLEVVKRRPLQRRDRRELPRHRPQRVQVLKVPQLEGGADESHDEVLPTKWNGNIVLMLDIADLNVMLY